MEDAISELRTFNRFFTKEVGALDASFLGTEMTLPEARVLYELAQGEPMLASGLQEALGMDPGFVSRIVARFERRGWVIRGRADTDARRRPIALTDTGREAFDQLDSRQREVVRSKVAVLEGRERGELVDALRLTRRMLGSEKASAFSLRGHRAGDMGLVAARQAILYREANGWDERLEVNVGEVTYAFLKNFKPERERCWIAEVDGRIAGSIFVTDESGGLSRLRLLYVEPFARGLGIGNALVTACVDFARAAGYDRMTLWTHTELQSARRIYAAHGFVLTETEVHDRFGPTIQSETWELDLT